MNVNTDRCVRRVIGLMEIGGVSGEEAVVAAAIRNELKQIGINEEWVHTDSVNRHAAVKADTGNLIVKIPGTVRRKRILLSAHMDKVPLCRGAVPVIENGRIVPKGKTALGADDRAGIACILSAVESVIRSDVPRPPLTLFFPVGEEVGLIGSRFVTKKSLGQPAMGFNVDNGHVSQVIIGATGDSQWKVDVHGISAHAGMRPKEGVSAVLIAARALADLEAKGLQGRVEKGRQTGTSNVGSICGGEATNQVMDHLEIIGETRSHKPAFLNHINREIKQSFEKAAASMKTLDNSTGSIEFQVEPTYRAFKLNKSEAVIQKATASLNKMGFEPVLRVIDGGLDANNLNEKGIPTVTLGAGAHHAHNLKEYLDIKEHIQGVELLIRVIQECAV